MLESPEPCARVVCSDALILQPHLRMFAGSTLKIKPHKQLQGIVAEHGLRDSRLSILCNACQ